MLIPTGAPTLTSDTVDVDHARPATSGALLPRGTNVGRFVVLEHVATGGMGTLYRAYDPQLDRAVALKLLRSPNGAGQDDAMGERLLREAKLLARLAHPNVVAVFDAGSFDGQVFVAMEFVEGVALREWLRVRRSLDEILDAFTAAGEGLSAAHAAGVVHRDFKPDNVIVGADGRVRVVDFGVARVAPSTDGWSRSGEGPTATLSRRDVGLGADGRSSTPSASGAARSLPSSSSDTAPSPQGGVAAEQARSLTPSSSDRASVPTPTTDAGRSLPHVSMGTPLDAPLTRGGAVVGTPRYMSIEQMTGREVSEASDQFSFCVTLFEALAGRLPFSASSRDAYVTHIAARRVAFPKHARVPAWLKTLVLRGLSPTPAERFPTMADLLAALRRGRQRRGRGTRWAAFALLTLSASLAFAWQRSQGHGVCSGAPAKMAAVWGAQQKAALEGAFTSTSLPYAKATLATVVRDVESYASTWIDARTEACVATRVRGDQSTELMDLRIACLDRRLAELNGLVQALEHADASTIENAATSVRSLPALRACADVERLLRDPAAPRDPVARERAVQVERKLSRADAMLLLGRAKEAALVADEAVEESRAAAVGAVLAKSLLAAGKARSASGELRGAGGLLSQAASEATAAHADEVLLGTFTELAMLRGRAQDRYEEAELLVGLARGEAARLGDPPELVANLRLAESAIAYRRERFDDAHALAEQARRLVTRTHGPDDPRIVAVLLAEGNALSQGLKLDAAENAFREAARVAEGALGADHPALGKVENNLGNIEQWRGHWGEALVHYDRARAIYANARAERQAGAIDAAYNAAFVLHHIGRAREALDLQRQVRAAYEALNPGPSIDVATTNFAIGCSLSDLGRVREAEEALRRSIHEYEGVGHYEIRFPLWALGMLQLEHHRPAEAVASLRRVVAISTEAMGEGNPDTAKMSADLGLALVEAGHRDEGRALLEKAVVTVATATDPGEIADVELTLAEGLKRLHAQPARVRTLAMTARARIADRGAYEPKMRARADALLRDAQ